MTDYRLLVFDWDGTLMDSEARIVNCLRAAIGDLSLEAREEDALRNIIGLGLREALQMLYPAHDEATHQRLVERYRHHYLVADPTPTALFPGARDLLEELNAAGYLLAIATGKGRRGLDQALREQEVQGLFHATRCADETFSKPHPQMLLDVMDLLGAEPAETLMIGDTEYDMQMAHNAGAHGLAVSYGVHARERLLQCGPRGCVDSIAQLRGWLVKPVRSAQAVEAGAAAAGKDMIQG